MNKIHSLIERNYARRSAYIICVMHYMTYIARHDSKTDVRN